MAGTGQWREPGNGGNRAMAGTGQWTEAVRRAFPIPVFVLGVAGGAVLMEMGRRRRWRAPNALVLTLAMGLQNAALRRVAGESIRTMYVSGMLTSGTEQMVALLFWLRDRTRGRGLPRLRRALMAAPRQKSWEGTVLPLGIWVCDMAGAVPGADLRQPPQ